MSDNHDAASYEWPTTRPKLGAGTSNDSAFYVKLTFLEKIADWDAELLVRPAKLLSSPFPGSLGYCWS
jgi:hypothetical protein